MHQKCRFWCVCVPGAVGRRDRGKVGAIKEKEKTNVCMHPL